MANKDGKYHRTTDWDAINAKLREGGRKEGETWDRGRITRTDSDLPGVWLVTNTYEDGTVEKWLQRKAEKHDK